MCIWDHCHVGTPHSTHDPTFWLMVFGSPEEFGDNPPSSLFHLAAKQLHSIILPAPCLTVGLVFLGLKASPSLLQTNCCALWPNNLVFVSGYHRFFLQVFSLSIWSAANYSRALRCHVWSKGWFPAQQPLSMLMLHTHTHTAYSGHWHLSPSSF